MIPVIWGEVAGYTKRRAIFCAQLPGVELVEMERNQRWAWCCGGGGGVPEADPDLAQWSATDRMREAKNTGAELVLTSSALCQRSFDALEQPALPTQDLLNLSAKLFDSCLKKLTLHRKECCRCSG